MRRFPFKRSCCLPLQDHLPSHHQIMMLLLVLILLLRLLLLLIQHLPWNLTTPRSNSNNSSNNNKKLNSPSMWRMFQFQWRTIPRMPQWQLGHRKRHKTPRKNQPLLPPLLITQPTPATPATPAIHLQLQLQVRPKILLQQHPQFQKK